MEYVCPVCETAGNSPENDPEKPIIKTTCRSCAAILLINADSGRVEAHKSSLKDAEGLAVSEIQQKGGASSVLSMRPEAEKSRDWLAISVVAVVLIITISAGIYFTVHRGIIQKPLQSASELIEDLGQHKKKVEQK